MSDYPLIETGTTKAKIDTALGELNNVSLPAGAVHDGQVLTYIEAEPFESEWQAVDIKVPNWIHGNTGNDFTTSPVAGGANSFAIGFDATSDSGSSMAIGYSATAEVGSSYSSAIGYNAESGGLYSVALGSTARAIGSNTIAIGSGSIAALAFANNSIAIGQYSITDSDQNKILVITNDAGLRITKNGILETTNDGGNTWITNTSSEWFAIPSDPADRFDIATEIGTIVHFNGVEWERSRADDQFTIGAAVVDWIGANGDYSIKNAGMVHNIRGEVNEDGDELIPGHYYYLSTTNAGKITENEPDTAGHFVVPVYVATTSTSALILPFRANLIGTPVAAAQIVNHKMLFKSLETGLESTNSDNFKIKASGKNWMMHADKELFRSEDNGITWTKIRFASSSQTEHTYDIDTNKASKWIATQEHYTNKMLVSHDNGITWKYTSLDGVNYNFRKIAYGGNLTWILYGHEKESYLVSTDNGNTWIKASDLLFDNVVSTGPNTWVGWIDNIAYFSKDNGMNFKKVLTTNISHPNARIASKGNGKVICALRGDYVFKSSNWGETWFSLGNRGFDVTGFNGDVYVLITDKEGIWYASGVGDNGGTGCAVSIDDGASWYPGPSGLNISENADLSATSGDFGNDIFIVGRSPSQCSRTLLP